MSMRMPGSSLRLITSGFSLKETLITLGVLIAGLIITILSVLYTRNNIRRAAKQDFEYSCEQIKSRIDTRLDEHAQLLRSGVALFAVNDSVTREDWRRFYMNTRTDLYLPGIQGFGYSKLIPKDRITEYTTLIRNEGYPDYHIFPEGERDTYSSIIYLEPFSGRNLAAFGYDMFSEPTRRKAMVQAMDSNMAALTARVTLQQETDQDIQAGVLMYLPVYRNGMPINTPEERRAATKGWVYSPYRMRDLMQGIIGTTGFMTKDYLEIAVYDDTIISNESLLYDSRYIDSIIVRKPNLHLELPVEFNGKRWTLIFSGRKDELSFFHSSQLFIWVSGLIITLLLFILSIMQIRSNIRRLQIERLNSELAHLNADKDRFISILSHDLKSPFTAILGFLELLTTDIRRFSIDQIESHVRTINDAARNTYNLLEDLLMWTRAHSGKIPYNPANIKIGEIYNNVAETLLPQAETKNIKIEFTSSEPDLQVYADKDMLKGILRNLISNSIKFTPSGGWIKITASRHNGISEISVYDNGTGIRPEQYSSLFDISKMLSTSGTAGEKGSGLGLILCKEFVETHKGKIWFVSEPGKGSDFRFTLPDKKD
jgi:signal transduction histidine kinase